MSTESPGTKPKNTSRFGLIAGVVVLAAGAALLAVYLIGAARVESDVPAPAQASAVEPPPEAAPAPAQGAPAPADAPAFDLSARLQGPPTGSYDAYLSWMQAHTDETEPFLQAKWERSRILLTSSKFPEITHQRVLEAFLRTPREYFCRPQNLERAYANAALPIGYGQTISGPHMVSRMTNAIDPGPNDKVLEIGTGSGYQSAVLSEMTDRVYTIEIVDALAAETDQLYQKHYDLYPEYRNIKRKADDGYYGWPEYAPFDRIIVTAGIDHIPPPLLQQLAPDGIMVIPIGPPSGQKILKITKRVAADGTVTLDREDIFAGTGAETHIFVPFTKKGGGAHTQGP